jgi:putative transposase
MSENENVSCKYCNSDKTVVKFGLYKGNQLYYCKACKRKFKADGSLFHMKVPANYVSSALDMYYRGLSVEDISEHLEQEYEYKPSKSVIYDWIDKYTDKATQYFMDFKPIVGDTWIADETMLDLDGGHKIWFYDMIDEKTRFLIASRVALTRTTQDAQLLMEEALKKTGKIPKKIITDSNYSYLDGIEIVFGGDTEHIQSHPFTDTNSSSMIERFHETLKDRTKIFKAFRDVDTLIEFTDGWLIYYNYFKPHSALEGKTPAEKAEVKYDVKDWKDFTRLPMFNTDSVKIVTPKQEVDMSKAFKRHRGHRKPKNKPNGSNSIQSVRLWGKMDLMDTKVKGK